MIARSVVLLTVGIVLAGPAGAQEWQVVAEARWCDEGHWGDRDRDRFCEVRETTLPAGRSVVSVDGRDNGGIEVTGWDKNEILVRAKVQAYTDEREAARDLVQRITIATDGTIRAEGPRLGRHDHWAVSYEIFVPRNSSLDLATVNGGITISDVSGRIDFRATNGGVHLSDLGGNVRGHTTNGGLRVELSGTEWQGEGLDVRTTNGGVTIDVPSNYHAELETGTVNGGLRLDFPITVQGRIDRTINATLGRGGKLIRATTTNGGVVVRRS